MFKSSFAKYLTAFVIIITISFLMLSGIITSIVRTYLSNDKVDKLELSSMMISHYFEEKNVENLERFVSSGQASGVVTLRPLVSSDYNFNILVTNTSGRVILSTLIKNDEDKPCISGDMGTLDILSFDIIEAGNGVDYLSTEGKLPGVTDEKSLVYGTDITTKGSLRGYVFTLVSEEKEDKIITIVRNTVINASVWVMLAAVIAAYFITERMIHPMKTMTVAARKFAKGDFRERVNVTGQDEIAELGTAFNNMADSLDSLEKMRNSFLANVSHDLRTPMTTILGFIEGITSGAIPPEQHMHYLNVISSEVHRLSRLVSLLLDISRLESGDRKFTFVDFDVAEVARLIIISFEKQLDDKKLDVEFDSDEDTMPVYADKDAIHQVMYNLCHNAIKFSNEGGKFRITLKRVPGNKIFVSIFDQGQVISDEDAAHIFDRFYKTDKSRGLDKTGVGLGLYICKTIVDAHGEKINVVPHEDGCEFNFTLKEGNKNNIKPNKLI